MQTDRRWAEGVPASWRAPAVSPLYSCGFGSGDQWPAGHVLGLWQWIPGWELFDDSEECGWAFCRAGDAWIRIDQCNKQMPADSGLDELSLATRDLLGHSEFKLVSSTDTIVLSRDGNEITIPVAMVASSTHEEARP